MKRCFALILAFLIAFSLSPSTLADTPIPIEIEVAFNELSILDTSLSSWVDAEIQLAYSFPTSTGRYLNSLYHVTLDDEYLGYFIFSEEFSGICEYSLGIDPITFVVQNLCLEEEFSIVYNLASYELTTISGRVLDFDSFGNIQYDSSEINSSDILPNLPYGLLPGVDPQLQNSDNCIVAATANLMWYWEWNKLSGLIGTSSFSVLKSRLTSAMGLIGYANNNIAPIIRGYVQTYSSGRTVTRCSADWTPSFGELCNEIDAGRPCLLGFKKGSDYSDTVGHMTCCVGYTLGPSTTNMHYVRLADGHSSSVVSKVWTTTYNDFIFYCSFA